MINWVSRLSFKGENEIAKTKNNFYDIANDNDEVKGDIY